MLVKNHEQELIFIEIARILMSGLHVVATVVWIGAIIMYLLVIFPGLKEAAGPDPPAFNADMKAMGKRMVRLVDGAILLVIGTGIYLDLNPVEGSYSTGLGEILFPLKLILVLAMVTTHLCRTRLLAPKIGRLTGHGDKTPLARKLSKLQFILAWVNCASRLCVLLLSAAI
ncbi:MAG: hypothetical protein RBG13Loki_2046 [Promethearchaeota archaeon CR_4]|nr:MAG: hypothetical protein RBG13Loki_2046 [Candidatus Lokiarchaeota archaeon CR_4]